MTQKNKKTIYLVSTVLLSAMMLMSAGMYFFNYEMVSETFIRLGYPTYLIYPLAIAKILGVVALWTKKNATLREWAYAGFFYDFILALTAHLHAQDGEYGPAFATLTLLILSYIYKRRIIHLS